MKSYTFLKHTLKYGALRLLLLSTLLSLRAYAQTDSTLTAPNQALVSQGEALFKGNCTVCHQINEKVIGPPLRDVHKRQPISWVKAFIKNSQKVIQSGDPYAVALYEEYNKTQMTPFDFSDTELDAIVAYIVNESTKPIPTPTASSDEEDSVTAEASSSSALEVQMLWAAFTALLLVFVIMLSLFISFIKSYALQKAPLSEQDRGDLERKPRKSLMNSSYLSFVVFFFVAIVVKSILDGLFSIGVQQGYQPQQPIAFSHKLHAGTNQIDCNYCHTGVYKSKSANIPSANMCMNCHGEILKESPEIQKIYTAIEQNRPIEWVRVHNLPDLSYFNHAQHVAVGGIACETCHGDIKNMDVVYQHAPLTMSWCINCHRTTEIQKENAYYAPLSEIQKQASPVHVEDIGGLECSKCHY